MKRSTILLTLLLCAFSATAQELRISPTFASGMIMQQLSEVNVWGWSAPHQTVTLKSSWDKKAYRTSADGQGRWCIKIDTPAGGYDPQQMSVSAEGRKIVIDDILLGDVWFVGGQSNMQMNFRGNPDQPVDNAQHILLQSRRKGIRLFRVEQGYSLSESDTTAICGKWSYATPETVKEFSVVGYIFGKCINDAVDIPVGLVQSAHGGSTAEAWIDRATLEKFGGFDLDIKPENVDPIWYAVLPTVLYNKMLKPLLPMCIKGVIWYQGEANVGRAAQYRTLFAEMIAAWRRYFEQPELPFYYVQIAPYEYENANSAELREAQLNVMRDVKNVGMAVTLDVGEATVIHPARKEVVGERLAYWALNRTYGMKAFGCRGPELRSIKFQDGHAFLKFDYAPNGLSFFGKQPSGFEIAGVDRKFHKAEVRVTPAFWGNEGLEVWSELVAEPVAVRYGFTNFVNGTLYNTEGLPASSFRTDDW